MQLNSFKAQFISGLSIDNQMFVGLDNRLIRLSDQGVEMQIAAGDSAYYLEPDPLNMTFGFILHQGHLSRLTKSMNLELIGNVNADRFRIITKY
jgi:hypothetical protein